MNLIGFTRVPRRMESLSKRIFKKLKIRLKKLFGAEAEKVKVRACF